MTVTSTSGEGVGSDVAVREEVGVGAGVAVGVLVGVGVGATVGVDVALVVGVAAGAGAGVLIGDGIGVCTGMGVDVGVGVGVACPERPHAADPSRNTNSVIQTSVRRGAASNTSPSRADMAARSLRARRGRGCEVLRHLNQVFDVHHPITVNVGPRV